MMSEKVLIVDDDENLLKGLRRNLRKKFDLELAFGGPAAKELIDAGNHYAVIVSDMQMPDLSGLELLQYAWHSSPHSFRIMLTGNADQKTAIDAVNEGSVFRFINKPCDPEELESAVNAALEQYRLLRAEQQVLEQTLNGSIELMSDVLALLDPAAFGRARRNKNIVRSLCDTLKFNNGWQLEAATLFAQIGRATVPDDILQKIISGEELTEEQQQIFDEHPAASARLVRRIPRLEVVSEIIESQNLTNNDETEIENTTVAESAALLDMVLAYDTFSLSCTPSESVRKVAKEKKFSSQPTWIDALHAAVAENVEIQKVMIKDLVPGMVLDEDILDAAKILIVTKEQVVTESLIQRLTNFKRARRKIAEPIAVRIHSS